MPVTADWGILSMKLSARLSLIWGKIAIGGVLPINSLPSPLAIEISLTSPVDS